jgi:hypothetical protein
MRKIPTLFARDFSQPRAPITREYHPDALWVPNGEGVATRKYDGTAALVQGGVLFKRHAVKSGKPVPEGFSEVEYDSETDKRIGWVPVGDTKQDKWFHEALQDQLLSSLRDGTYELIGPKVQSNDINPEKLTEHELVYHGDAEVFTDVPTGFDELREWLAGRDIEGLVWHHPDGRMAKIKCKDFGLKRGA